ncbi:1-phosphatidylinositol 4,5-bisphosphate phosphodiesterase delta-4 [Ciona intestinalis]
MGNDTDSKNVSALECLVKNDTLKAYKLGSLQKPQSIRKTPMNHHRNVPTNLHKAICANVELTEIFQRLQSGERFLLVRKKRWWVRQKYVRCRLDDDFLYFRYVPEGVCCASRRERKVDIRHIRIVRTGNAIALTKKVSESQCFSMVVDNSNSVVLNFVAPSEESASNWILGLNLLMRRIKSLTPRLQHELFVWELFNSFDADKNGFVTFKEAKKLLRKSGVPVTTYTRHHFFKRAEDTLQDFNAFTGFYEFMTKRAEISKLFQEISADKLAITSRELYKFLQKTQKDTDVTEGDCEQIIEEYEVEDVSRHAHQMSPRGFSLFLNSNYSAIFNWRHDKVYQDMKQPLSHYFIASSHNTYLTGDQIKDPSSTDAYMNALLKGCRCVELDCWDGPDGDPVIYHGYTLTSKLKFKDVVQVIGKYAFEVSDYPLILSIENHCSVAQQEKMAFYLKGILGSELLTMPVISNGKESVLPSPHALMGKILLKGKKLPPRCHYEADDVSLEDEAADIKTQEDAKMFTYKFTTLSESSSDMISLEEKPVSRLTSFSRDAATKSSFSGSSNRSSRKQDDVTKHKLALALSDLVIYCKSVKFKSLTSNLCKPYRFSEMSSFTEAKANRLAKHKQEDTIDYHKLQLSRTYPAGTRTDSSNYDPQPLWNAGFQIVALNYQTRGEEMEIYDGKFRQNGGCGYILKPPDQRGVEDEEVAKTMKLKIISGQRLTGRTSNYDDTSLQVEVSTSGDQSDVNRCVTKFDKNSGFDPKWNDEFICFITKPELAMVRFVVKTQTHDRIGQNTIPFNSIAQGYRHIPMLDRSGARITSASIFVYIEINDAVVRHHNPGKVKMDKAG